MRTSKTGQAPVFYLYAGIDRMSAFEKARQRGYKAADEGIGVETCPALLCGRKTARQRSLLASETLG